MWNRIAPLQARGMPVWRYQDVTDKMRLHRSELSDEVVALIIKQLFAVDTIDPLPEFVVPLYENNRHERILAKMPACYHWGLILEDEVDADRPNPLVGQPCPCGDNVDDSEDTEGPEDAARDAASSRPTTAVPPPASRKHGKTPTREQATANGSK